ncbi:glycosyltransferase family 4 protein [Aristophania vespae]|uniref:glycosyltransferase family 4 protein n=1 Tax=Aristophania vespae TaxID=2697033 RepID=UPI0023511DDF|nr:glycosyltransferase family 1 protein [Aristophania vespae]UMM63556.1 hypothetical protein DM15PD_05300 [Aristophania vespae]
MVEQNSFRIAIDGFNLSLARGTGVATYARTLSRATSNLGYSIDILYGLNISAQSSPLMREIRFFELLASQEQRKPVRVFSKSWFKRRKEDISRPEISEIPISHLIDSRSFAERLPVFNRLLNADNLFNRAARYFARTGKFMTLRIASPPDVMHWTYPLPIRLEGAANIYTIHDVVPLRLPHTTLDNKPHYFSLLKKIGRLADGICTISEASKKDILSFFPEMEPKLYNCYQSCDTTRPAFIRSAEESLAEIEADFGLSSQSYFIFYGSLEPKKNIGRIIEAFLASKSQRKLVLVGAMAWKEEQELRYLEHGISTGRIIKIDYLPERTLFALLKHARALLFPSLCEGFGLPVIEAMSLGVPVLASNEGALAEIGGDAVLKAPAYEIEALTKAIIRLDHENELCEKLVSAGYSQVKKFSMSDYQNRLSRLYSDVLSSMQK